jgi:hypothetical protein
MIGLTFERCLPQHLSYIRVQEAQRIEQGHMVNTDYAEIATSHIALSAWVGNTCVGAAGIVLIYPHRAVAWALIGEDIGAALVPVTRKVRNFISIDLTPRIEMTVAADFKAGHVWAKLIGMKLETPEPLRKHGARGEDEMIYARVR